MNRAVLARLIRSKHVYAAACSGCHKWMYPIPILRVFSGFNGAMQTTANGKTYGFNFGFCAEACVEDFKVRRLEENWNGASVESLAYAKRKHQEEKERRANERPWKQDRAV